MKIFIHYSVFEKKNPASLLVIVIFSYYVVVMQERQLSQTAGKSEAQALAAACTAQCRAANGPRRLATRGDACHAAQ
jgi:hypothetical protein